MRRSKTCPAPSPVLPPPCAATPSAMKLSRCPTENSGPHEVSLNGRSLKHVDGPWAAYTDQYGMRGVWSGCQQSGNMLPSSPAPSALSRLCEMLSELLAGLCSHCLHQRVMLREVLRCGVTGWGRGAGTGGAAHGGAGGGEGAAGQPAPFPRRPVAGLALPVRLPYPEMIVSSCTWASQAVSNMTALITEPTVRMSSLNSSRLPTHAVEGC